ncbi:hypothetical protein [Streptomyces sp. WY228]|nr:hypothetical protein [Streptomyces sp. WY228]
MEEAVGEALISKSAANRSIDQLVPLIAYQPRRWFAKDAVGT